MSDKESFASLFAETARPARRFSVGDKLDVTVNKIGKVAVFVSLDENTEGYIDLPELADKHGKLEVELGTRLHARVAEVGGRSGAVRLTPVAIRGNYDEVQALSGGAKGNKADEPTLVVGLAVKVSVQKVEKFGVFVNIVGSKKRALLRAQDTGTRRGADLTKDFPPGKELEVKIINISDDGKIGVSITALALDEERQNFTAHEAGEAEAAQAGGAPKGGKGKGGGAAPLKPGMDGKAPKSLGTLGDLLANVKVKK